MSGENGFVTILKPEGSARERAVSKVRDSHFLFRYLIETYQ